VPLLHAFAAPSPPLALFDGQWLKELIDHFTSRFEPGSFFWYDFNVLATLALVLVSLCCGMVGSLVVGSRLAFFSDALAHCSFAGVSIGFLIFEGIVNRIVPGADFWQWVTPIMVAFGMLVGYGIASVRQHSGLTGDTVIGVFFAGAIGLAAMLRQLIQSRRLFNLEDFLFGNPLNVLPPDLVYLGLVTLVTILVLLWTYNDLLLAGFNPSLALSRRVPVRRVNYLFVVLLALIVNVCLRSVGVLLINALMVVPGATAILLSRNLRQLFWLTIALTLLTSLGGQYLSWEVSARAGVKLGIPGTIILLNVVLFVGALLGRQAYEKWAARREADEPAVKRPGEPLPGSPA
jgi:zinc transport system permease protein